MFQELESFYGFHRMFGNVLVENFSSKIIFERVLIAVLTKHCAHHSCFHYSYLRSRQMRSIGFSFFTSKRIPPLLFSKRRRENSMPVFQLFPIVYFARSRWSCIEYRVTSLIQAAYRRRVQTVSVRLHANILRVY